MKIRTLKGIAVKVAAVGLLAGGLGGCATGNSGGTAALHQSGQLKGRDVGRGGATSGGLSSLDTNGNAADRSIYDARQIYQ